MKQRQSSVLFFATALLSFAIENISASRNNIVMIGTGLMSPSQLSYKPCLAFAGNNLSACNPLSPRRLAKSWSRAAAPLSILCAKISTSSTTSATAMKFAPFPFLNHNNMVSSASSWSPMSYSSTTNDECALPSDTRDNFSRYSKFLVKNSNGVDGLGKTSNDDESEEELLWVDTLGENQCTDYQSSDGSEPGNANNNNAPPRPFSILSWNILAQALYEGQYQRRRIQQVALSPMHQQPHHMPPSLSTTSSPHPHPWPKRLKRIVEILSHANPDVICLQECELQSFKRDLAPALSKFGYDGISQEDDRPEEDMPTSIKAESKHRDARNHIVATFWKRDKFECIGEASVRTRSLTTVLKRKTNEVASEEGAADENEDEDSSKAAEPMVAVVNVHLEGHPRRFSERTHQLQHAMSDLAKRIEHERKNGEQSTASEHEIGKLNALVLAGDFNCELQSSACSTYLRMGRLGRKASLGGIHGEDSTILPPSLLETTEATEVIHPIMEWGRALPEEKVSDVDPHPFRRNGMTSAYPAWLGRDDATHHFTFCSELSKRPVPGLDQLWYTSMTLERTSLRTMFVDDSGLWERYFYDDAEVEKRRDEERMKVLASGLPSMDCKYPSDHLPIGAVFDWKWEDCGDSCLLDEDEAESKNEDGSAPCIDEGEVRGLNVVDSEGNNIQDESLQDHKPIEKQSFETPHEELDYLIGCCPYDSEQQQANVQFILSPLDPPLDLTAKERPTVEQMEQLGERRIKKAEMLKTASLGVRPWLKNMWKLQKNVAKWDRRILIAEMKEAEAEEAEAKEAEAREMEKV